MTALIGLHSRHVKCQYLECECISIMENKFLKQKKSQTKTEKQTTTAVTTRNFRLVFRSANRRVLCTFHVIIFTTIVHVHCSVTISKRAKERQRGGSVVVWSRFHSGKLCVYIIIPGTMKAIPYTMIRCERVLRMQKGSLCIVCAG